MIPPPRQTSSSYKTADWPEAGRLISFSKCKVSPSNVAGTNGARWRKRTNKDVSLRSGPRPAGPSPRAAGANSRAAALRNAPSPDSDAIILIANLFTSVLLAAEKPAEYLNDLPSAKQLSELAEMNEKKELSSTATKEVFLKLFDPQMRNKDTRSIAKELGVIQENDLGALEAIVDTVLAKPETAKAQADFKAGEEKVIGFLVGQVMKESHGKANPSAVQEILRKKLK